MDSLGGLVLRNKSIIKRLLLLAFSACVCMQIATFHHATIHYEDGHHHHHHHHDHDHGHDHQDEHQTEYSCELFHAYEKSIYGFCDLYFSLVASDHLLTTKLPFTNFSLGSFSGSISQKRAPPSLLL